MLQFTCTNIEWVEDVENEELTMVLHLPDGKEALQKLFDEATQADLSFTGIYDGENSFLTFILRNGNGEIGINLPKSEWERLLDEPDHLLLEFGDSFKMEFLPRTFNGFIDEQIEKANAGEQNPFIEDILDVFTES